MSGDGTAREGGSTDGAGQPEADGGSTVSHDELGDPELDMEYLMQNLEELEQTVDSDEEREQVRYTMRVARRVPGSEYVEASIQKYTTRDVAEAFVGGILLSLPLLVEDGVFEIAEWFTHTEQFGIEFGFPVFLLANVLFTAVMTIGLLYWADIKEVSITRPILGFIPRRLVGVLTISLIVAAGMMYMWGRLAVEDPSRVEIAARISVLWTAAAFGAALGDILPGESKGHDVTVDNLENIVKPD